MQLAWKVAEDSKVKLKDYDPDAIDTYTDRALAAAELELALLEQLGHTKPGNHENKRSKKVQKAHAAT